MTLGEILDGYEDLWRQAALEDAKQMSVNPHASGPSRSCAWIAAEYFGHIELKEAATQIRVVWRGQDLSIASVMVILNNNEHWTWDMFANKFRDALAEGEAAAKTPEDA